MTLDDEVLDAEAREEKRQREPDEAAADDQNGDLLVGLDQARSLTALDQRDAIADPSPGLVAGQYDVGFELIGRREHDRVRKPQASGLAAELRCRPRDRRGQRFDADREVREERLDRADCLGPSAIRRDEDLGVRRGGNQQLVVLVLGEGLNRRTVKRIVGIEKRDDDRRVEND
jgi:hypothetical protein